MSIVLVTGCSSGFGELAARSLADRGHVVFATMRAVDGRNAEPASALEAHGADAAGEIHVLELDVTDDASVRRAVSAAEERAGAPDAVINNAGRMFLGLTESLRYELAPFGVEVVLVEPGPFGTKLFPSVTGPADGERVAAYGEKGREIYETVLAALGGVIEDPDAPSDPTLVVDTLVELVEAEPGERPFRSVVGVDFGTRGINQELEPYRQGVLGGIGMPELDRVAS